MRGVTWMINLKEYIVTLMAMFLSLGIGILVGTSITGSVVVEQQKHLIEQLENRYYQALKDLEELNLDVSRRDDLLRLYDLTAESLLPRETLESLKGREVALISLDWARGREVGDFLLRYEVKPNPHIYLPEGLVGSDGAPGEALQEILVLVRHLLQGGEVPGNLKYAVADPGDPARPEDFLLVLGGIAQTAGVERFLAELLGESGVARWTILEDFFRPDFSSGSREAEGLGVIDYIDTAAGKAALLLHLAGRAEAAPLKPLLEQEQ
jgi:hypothetical protein